MMFGRSLKLNWCYIRDFCLYTPLKLVFPPIILCVVKYSFHFIPYICYCLKGNLVNFTDLQNVLFYHLYLCEKYDAEYSTYYQMCHMIIITYRIIRKHALQCGNWEQQQRIILFIPAYENNKETVILNSSLSV